jgi:hypothetical protein
MLFATFSLVLCPFSLFISQFLSPLFPSCSLFALCLSVPQSLFFSEFFSCLFLLLSYFVSIYPCLKLHLFWWWAAWSVIRNDDDQIIQSSNFIITFKLIIDEHPLRSMTYQVLKVSWFWLWISQWERHNRIYYRIIKNDPRFRFLWR